MIRICRRSGVTGRSTPAHRADAARPGAGRADDRVGADRAAGRSRRATISPPTVSMPVDRAVRQQPGARPAGRRRVAEDDRLGRAVPVGRGVRRGEQPLGARSAGDSAFASATSIIRLGTPSSFCSATFCSKRRDVLGRSRAGTGSRPGAGRSPGRTPRGTSRRSRRLRSPSSMLTGRRTGRVRRRPPCRSTRTRVVALHEHDVAHAGRGELVRRAEPDHAAADDDHRRPHRLLLPGPRHRSSLLLRLSPLILAPWMALDQQGFLQQMASRERSVDVDLFVHVGRRIELAGAGSSAAEAVRWDEDVRSSE